MRLTAVRNLPSNVNVAPHAPVTRIGKLQRVGRYAPCPHVFDPTVAAKNPQWAGRSPRQLTVRADIAGTPRILSWNATVGGYLGIDRLGAGAQRGGNPEPWAFPLGSGGTQRPSLAYCHVCEAACAALNAAGSAVNCLSRLIHSAGTSNRHLIPLVANTSSTLPPSSKGMRSRMILVP